jgi:hypothetical protein
MAVVAHIRVVNEELWRRQRVEGQFMRGSLTDIVWGGG